MRPNTIVWLGLNNVGAKNEPPQFFEGTVIESFKVLAKWLGAGSMATRFDIVIARNESDCRKAIRIRQAESSNSIDVEGDLMESLERMMQETPDVGETE